jgi:hypothetical protein
MIDWISVKDEMPKKHGIAIIVYTPEYGVSIDEMRKDGKWYYGDGTITHWAKITNLPGDVK